MIKFLKNIFTLFREEPLAEGWFECKMCRYEYPLETESRHPQKGYCMGCFPNCNNLSCDGIARYNTPGLTCDKCAHIDAQKSFQEMMDREGQETLRKKYISRLKILDSIAIHAPKEFFLYHVDIKERLRSFAEYSYDYAEAMMAEREKRFEFYKNTNNQ